MCIVEYGKASRAPGPVERAVSLISCKRSWARAGMGLSSKMFLHCSVKIHCDLSGKIKPKPGIPNYVFNMSFGLKRHKRVFIC